MTPKSRTEGSILTAGCAAAGTLLAMITARVKAATPPAGVKFLIIATVLIQLFTDAA
jgi:hypothetical protein